MSTEMVAVIVSDDGTFEVRYDGFPRDQVPDLLRDIAHQMDGCNTIETDGDGNLIDDDTPVGCPVGGTCPQSCDRTQSGCENIWGPDTQWAEAIIRNRLGGN